MEIRVGIGIWFHGFVVGLIVGSTIIGIARAYHDDSSTDVFQWTPPPAVQQPWADNDLRSGSLDRDAYRFKPVMPKSPC